MKDVHFYFEKKNIVVVGASSGIGKKITLDLAESGAHILAVARNEERLLEIKKLYPDQIDISILDVTIAKADDWDNAIRKFVNKYGKLNGGIYTAGITGMTALKMHDDDMARRIMNVSFWGAARFIQSASKKKHAEKESSFVFFSSSAAYTSDKGMFAYVAAKRGIQAAAKSWAKELCRDMHRVNTVSPGWVETEMTKDFMKFMGWDSINDDSIKNYHLGLGKPEDVSGVVLFLLSDAARWITGIDVVVDGGLILGVD